MIISFAFLVLGLCGSQSYASDPSQLLQGDMEKISRTLDSQDWGSSQVISISSSKADLLRKGLAQRVKALNAFLSEVLRGTDSYLEAGIPEAIVSRILRDTKAKPRFVRPGENSFIYGPDVIEDHKGRLFVIEDQSTLVTGLDLVDKHSRHFFKAQDKDFKEYFEKPDDHFWTRANELIKEQAHGGKVVLLRYATPSWALRLFPPLKGYKDHWAAVEKKLASLNVEVVEVLPFVASRGFRKKLEVNSNGVFLNGERVGFIFNGILNDHMSKSLLKAYQEKKVELSQSPGVEVLDSKLLIPFVDNMIRHYLHQEPLISSAPSYSFVKAGLFETVFNDLGNYVLKDTQPHSAGGRGVYLGDKMTKEEISLLKKRIRKDPLRYIAQKRIYPLTAKGFIYDFRTLVYVNPHENVVSHLPISRLVPEDVGKTNFSNKEGGVLYAPVLERKSCAAFLSDIKDL